MTMAYNKNGVELNAFKNSEMFAAKGHGNMLYRKFLFIAK